MDFLRKCVILFVTMGSIWGGVFVYAVEISPEEPLANTTIIDPATGVGAAPAPRPGAISTAFGDEAKKCSLIDGNILGCFDTLLGWIIKGVFSPILVAVLEALGIVFEKAIMFAFSQFPLFSDGTLYPLWALNRNIANIIFLFATIYAIFMFVIDKQDKIQKYLPLAIIFILLVNFSYIGVISLVKGSNTISQNIYNSIVPQSSLSSPGAFGAPITLQIMSALGVNSIREVYLNPSGTGSTVAGQTSSIGTAITFVALLIYFAFVLFSLTWMVIMTSLVFMAAIIFAPFLLMSPLVPGLGKYISQGRQIFLSHLALGPVLLTLLYINLSIITIINSNIQVRGLLQGGPGADQTVLFFGMLFIIGMLHMTLKICKSLSGAVGEAASNAVGNAVGAVSWINPVGRGLSVAARLGQGTIGRMARNQMASGGLVGGLGGRGTLLGDAAHTTLKRMGNASYDLRALPGLASVAKVAGMDDRFLGKAEKGYLDRVKDREASLKKDADDYANDPTLKNNPEALRQALERRTSQAGGLRDLKNLNIRNFGVSDKAKEEAKMGAQGISRQSLRASVTKLLEKTSAQSFEKLSENELRAEQNRIASEKESFVKEGGDVAWFDKTVAEAMKERVRSGLEEATKEVDPRKDAALYESIANAYKEKISSTLGVGMGSYIDEQVIATQKRLQVQILGASEAKPASPEVEAINLTFSKFEASPPPHSPSPAMPHIGSPDDVVNMGDLAGMQRNNPLPKAA